MVNTTKLTQSATTKSSLALHPIFFVLLASAVPAFSVSTAANAQSSKAIYLGSDNRLRYPSDGADNRIPDYSYGGYRYGDVPIPTVNHIQDVAIPNGDEDQLKIQVVIDSLCQTDPKPDGFRGVVLLRSGTYTLEEPILIHCGGIVLRGRGSQATTLKSTWRGASSPAQALDGAPPGRNWLAAPLREDNRFQVVLAGNHENAYLAWDHPDWREAAQYRIDSEFTPVGSHIFKLLQGHGLRKGDRVIFKVPCTQTWLNALAVGWTDVCNANLYDDDRGDLDYLRTVTAVNGRWIELDAPIYNHVDDRHHPLAYFSKLIATPNSLYQTRTHRNIGVERLTIDIDYVGSENGYQLQDLYPNVHNGVGRDVDETHAPNGITFRNVEHGWIRDTTIKHYSASAIQLEQSVHITVEANNAIEPVSLVQGGRRYAFHAAGGTQLALFQANFVDSARHGYMLNGEFTSGVTFYNNSSSNALELSESHRHWNHGLLYDNHRELNPRGTEAVYLGLYRHPREPDGTDLHGWTTAHSTAWNVDLKNRYLAIAKPPIGQNYAIGYKARVRCDDPLRPNPSCITGFNAIPGQFHSISSLYLKQKSDRPSIASRTSSNDFPTVNIPISITGPNISVCTATALWRADVANAGLEGATLRWYHRQVGASQWVSVGGNSRSYPYTSLPWDRTQLRVDVVFPFSNRTFTEIGTFESYCPCAGTRIGCF